MRGITSNVNIMWRRGNEKVISTRKYETADATVGNYILVYRDSYFIPQLSTDDDGVKYECRLVVSATPPVIATATFRLNVTGEYLWKLA